MEAKEQRIKEEERRLSEFQEQMLREEEKQIIEE